MEEIASCQIGFIPVASSNYIGDINRVLDLIHDSGLEYEVGVFSTVIRGEENKVLSLITTIYKVMKDQCGFTMDVRISNVCGCGKK